MSREDNAGRRTFDIPQARWSDWEKTRIDVMDGAGNIKFAIAPDHPVVGDFLAAGGVIEPLGSPEEELSWFKRQAQGRIRAETRARVEQYGKTMDREALIFNVLFELIYGYTIHPNPNDKTAVEFLAKTYTCGENYLRFVDKVDTVREAREFDPTIMAWPKMLPRS